MSFQDQEHTSEYWASYAKLYTSQTTDLLSPTGVSLLQQLDERLPFSSKDTSVLDDGAGSGNTVISLRKQYPQVPIIATDQSEGMMQEMKNRLAQHSDWSPVETRVADAHDLTQANRKCRNFQEKLLWASEAFLFTFPGLTKHMLMTQAALSEPSKATLLTFCD